MSGVASVQFTINGTDYDLEYVSESGNKETWKVAGTAPSQTSGLNYNKGPGVGSNASGGYYNGALTITDYAGNVTTVDTTDTALGSALKLAVKEKTAPTVACTYPAEGAVLNSNSATYNISFTISDSGSGVKTDTIVMTVDGTTVSPTITKNKTDGWTGVTVTYPLSKLDTSKRAHTVSLYGSDYDGNKSSTLTRSFSLDWQNPEVSISFPEGLDIKTGFSRKGESTQYYTGNVYLTKLKSLPVNYTVSSDSILYAAFNSSVEDYSTTGVWSFEDTKEATESGTNNNSTDSGSFTLSSTATDYPLKEGVNTLRLWAIDIAGNKSGVVTYKFIADWTAPTVNSVTLGTNPATVSTNYETFITITVTDPDTES